MPRRTVLILLFMLIGLISLACVVSFPGSPVRRTATPVPDTETPTVDQTRVSEAKFALTGTAAAIHQATTAAFQTKAAAEKKITSAVVEKTQSAGQRATQRIVGAQTATAAVVQEGTQEAQSFYQVIQNLFRSRLITSTDGQYHRLADFDQSWAQINWYQWWKTGLTPTNFVIQADATWNSASETANFFASGCGFVFSENGQDNHYATFLALDGKVHNYRVKDGVFTEMQGGYYGHLDIPKGSAKLLLAVDQHNLTFFVNDRKVVRYEDKSLDQGSLGLTLFSGTNKDYGTRCTMQNIEVWILP